MNDLGLLGEHVIATGLILQGGNEGNCFFLIGCSLPRRKCLGALALSKMKHTGL